MLANIALPRKKLSFYLSILSHIYLILSGMRTPRKRATAASTVKRQRRQQYKSENLELAVSEVRAGTSLRKAAEKFGVPRSTLNDRILGKNGGVVGAPTALPKAWEDDLVKWLIGMSERGFPLTPKILLDVVQMGVSSSGLLTSFDENRPGRGWLRGFLDRHPQLSRRSAEGISRARAAVTADRILSWFEELDAFVRTNQLEDVFTNPRRVLNADETSIRLSPGTYIYHFRTYHDVLYFLCPE